MNNSVINVKLNAISEHSYPIIIGEDILKNANEYIEKYTSAKKILIVSNQKIYDLHAKNLNINNATYFLIPDGEEYKNFDIYQSILNKCFELKLERKDAIVAFGGGVIGDITGFVASTYLRGINFVQIPTTLLAQVDSSIGGKVAINNQYGKNLIGAFYQPNLVITDIQTLKTLDKRQFKTGLAEVLKYAFIEKTCNNDVFFDLFKILQTNISQVLSCDSQTLYEIIKICCTLKACVVFQDEKETGLRKILNFGHTYGHALEKLTNYKEYTHGEAVAIGMKYIFQNVATLNLSLKEYCDLATNLIDSYELIDIDKKTSFTQEEILSAMKFDKKVENGTIKFVVPNNYAEVKISTLL